MPGKMSDPDGHEVFQISADTSSMTYGGGELKVKESSALSGYSIRVLLDSRLGFSYCQDDKGIQEAIARARTLSRSSPISGFSFAPKSSFKRPRISDRSINPDDIEDLKGVLDSVRAAAESKKGQSRVIMSASRSETRLENTSGFFGTYDQTGISIYAETMDGDGFGYSYVSSNRMPEDPSEFGMKAAAMAREMKGAKKPKTGSYTVVMELEALGSLLDTLLPSLSGDWKRRNMSRLEVGEKMFDEQFSLFEDGLAAGSSARPFDDEGTPSETRGLIERGSVRSFLYDRETAALAGISGGGCCGRDSFDSAPKISESNLIIAGGDMKDLNEIPHFIEVHSAHGAHTANPASGDIGLEVSVAFECKGGIRKPLRGFMLSGNVFSLFNSIEAIEKRQQTLGSVISPRIAFSGVKVVS